ncbi:hypothetical protein JNB_05834 [Janibacter sp. HTCC2649]|uniref:hypothetical protein n=1 Tax=Janibacter sp. HTCC2649 TaxID=313589 RepID=UPI0000670BF0|nr:hypothetical protein [Janibacter sp. HTCC2649]EAP99664.1 hypothetical protein JNB_05834 [Janibacter sp. HTCC2649]
MRAKLLARLRGHEVAGAVALAAFLGLVLGVVPALDRVFLLVASAGLLVGAGALVVWLLRDHREIEWTTSSGTTTRVRGSDRRVTALARNIDASLSGDDDAARAVQATLRSLADARLSPQGLALDGPGTEAEAALGPDLTAYLSSSKPPHVNADELASFITTLEEH